MSIDLKKFIPLTSVDPVYFEDTHYFAADKGGEKRYRLLPDAIINSGRVAMAELVSRGKEQLVLTWPYGKGLVLHTMFHADEVRNFQEVPKGESVKSEKQLELGVGLFDRLHRRSSIRRITRRSIESGLAMLDEKIKGKGIAIPPRGPKHGQMIDIMEALKAQHEKNPANNPQRPRRQRRKRGVS